jgi:hypothetical protein
LVKRNTVVVLPSVVLAVSALWLLVSGRLLSLPLALLAVVLLTTGVRWRTLRHWAVAAWVLALATTFLPFDVTLRNYPGPPRFVPLIMGLPTADDAQKCERGEAVCGGCLVSGREPAWVLVW